MNNVICFGAGSFLEKYFKEIESVNHILYICDNDSAKWNTEFVCQGVPTGIKIVSPKKLQDITNEIVYVTSQYADEICALLKKMGINKFYVIDGGTEHINWKHEELLLGYLKESVKHIQLEIPFDYEAWISDVFKGWHNIYFHHNVKKLLPYLSKNSKILDYGFGCGTQVLNFLLLGYDAYGIDIDEKKYEYVMQLIDDLSLPTEWKNHFILYDGAKVCFDDGQFDLVSSYYVLEHVADCESMVSEMLRVCKNNGYIKIICPDYDNSYEEHYFLDLKKPLRGNKEEFYALIEQKKGNINYAQTLNFINMQDVYDMFARYGDEVEITDMRNKDKILTAVDLLVRKK